MKTILTRLVSLCFLFSAPAFSQELHWYRVPAPAYLAEGAAKDRGVPAVPNASLAGSELDSESTLKLSPHTKGEYDELIAQVARQYALDPLLMSAIVQTESAYRADAISEKGAQGLMQVIPATGRRFGKISTTDPRENLEAGAAYLSWLMKHFEGRLDLALAGYNAGEGAVERYGNSIPPYDETKSYVRKVLSRLSELRALPQAAAAPAVAATGVVKKSQRVVVSADDLGHLLRLLISGPRPGAAMEPDS